MMAACFRWGSELGFSKAMSAQKSNMCVSRGKHLGSGDTSHCTWSLVGQAFWAGRLGQNTLRGCELDEEAERMAFAS